MERSEGAQVSPNTARPGGRERREGGSGKHKPGRDGRQGRGSREPQPSEGGIRREGEGSTELRREGARESSNTEGREKAGGRGLEKAPTQRGLYWIADSVRNRGGPRVSELNPPLPHN